MREIRSGELTLFVRAWKKAGEPEGEAFRHFMRGRGPRYIITNCVLTVNGIRYPATFAMTNATFFPGEILFITKDETVICVDGRGRSLLIPRRRRVVTTQGNEQQPH